MSATLKDTLAFRREPPVSRYIPYSYHVTDSVISTASGDLVTVWRVGGRTFECASPQEMMTWTRDLNQMLRTIASPSVRLWTHLHHHAADEIPPTKFELSFPERLDANYRKTFAGTPLMTNDLYLSLVYTPSPDVAQRFFARFERQTARDIRLAQDDALAAIDEIASQIEGSMRSYGLTRLGVYYRDTAGHVFSAREKDGDDTVDPEDDLDGDYVPAQTEDSPHSGQHAFSSALEWFSYLLNGEKTPVPVCRERISEYLAVNRVVASNFGDLIAIRSVPERYVAAVEIRDYDEQSEPGQFNQLMKSPYEFILTQTFVCMSVGAARGFLAHQQKSLIETADPGVSQIAAIAEARDEVVSRRVAMGWHHGTVHVYGTSPRAVQQASRDMRVKMNDCAISATPVSLANEAAFYAMLPGNTTLRPRPAVISSANFLCFSPFHNYMTGKPDHNPWGPAVMMFKSVAGTPVFLNFHVTPLTEQSEGRRPAGHTALYGKTGGGKTTLLNALLASATKFDARMFIFDKDQGMLPLVKALRGHYTVLREGEPTGWQPVQLEPTRRNINFVKRLIGTLVEISLGLPLAHAENELISGAVEAVMGADSHIPHEYRSLTAVRQHMPLTFIEGRPSVASLLEPWCSGGQHGWLFDNPADTLDLSRYDRFGFDIGEFLAQNEDAAPPTRTPLLMYLLYRVRESIDGTRRTLVVFDEFAQYLDDPILDLEVKRGLKTDRKKDCVYIFSTQEPNDSIDSRIGKTIRQSISTLILLPNPEASREDYVNGLRITDAEFDRVVELPMESYQFLLKQGQQSTVVNFRLANMPEEIAILSGTPDNSERVNRIIEQVGDDPDDWMPLYWKQVVR